MKHQNIVFITCTSQQDNMSTNLQSPTKLTEFAPLQVEEKPQSVTQYISKFFKSTKPPEKSNSNEPEISGDSIPNWAVDTATEAKFGESEAPNVYPVDVNEGRSLPNVLKRISNLIALKTTVSTFTVSILTVKSIFYQF